MGEEISYIIYLSLALATVLCWCSYFSEHKWKFLLCTFKDHGVSHQEKACVLVIYTSDIFQLPRANKFHKGQGYKLLFSFLMDI